MQEEMLTVTQVMVMLKVSRMTVHRRVQEGRLTPANEISPALDRKRNMLFKRSDVEKLLQEDGDKETHACKVA